MDRFEALGAVVAGLSKDSVNKHDKFKAKYDLLFALISDETCEVCEDYGAWKEKAWPARSTWASNGPPSNRRNGRRPQRLAKSIQATRMCSGRDRALD